MYRPVGGRGTLCLDQAIPLRHSLLETDEESDRETTASDDAADMVRPVTGQAIENNVRPLGSKSTTAEHGETQVLELKITHIKKKDAQNPKSGGKHSSRSSLRSAPLFRRRKRILVNVNRSMDQLLVPKPNRVTVDMPMDKLPVDFNQQVPKPVPPGLVASKLKQCPGHVTLQSVDAPSTGLTLKNKSVQNGPNANRMIDPNESVPQKLKHALPKQTFRPVGGRVALCLDQKIPMVRSLSDDEGERANSAPANDAAPDHESPMGSKTNLAVQDQELGLKVTHLKIDSRNPKGHSKTG